MTKSKSFIGILGAVFILIGLYYRFHDPARSIISYEYLGIGTWLAGIIYYTLYQVNRVVVSFILGLLILHSGLLLILADELPDPKLLGAIIFTAGVIVVLGSGFSEYMKNRKRRAKYKQVPY